MPKPVHAFQSIAVFAVAGPLLGALVLALHSSMQGLLSVIFHPFVLIGSFVIGIVPAVLAGILYCALALVSIYVFPRVVINVWGGSMLGALAGAAGAAGFVWHLLHGNPNFLAKLTEMVPIGTLSGFLCGLLAGWFVPVGKVQPEGHGPVLSNEA